MKGYVELQAWQKAMDLAVMIYEVSAVMPSTERFGMTSQMQRAATSVPANIAEGYQRGTRKDYARFIQKRRPS
ncbi:four helix bundle protein [Brevundimonas sp.]